MQPLPLKSREYQNHHLDSEIWNMYLARKDDIILSTSIKSGTTWMQYIVLHLLFYKKGGVINTFETSPWLEERCINPQAIISKLEGQKHRRLIKTHLPLDGIHYDKNVKYIVVARDARDVFMSLWNHYRHLSTNVFSLLNHKIPNRVGNELPPCPENIIDFWHDWIDKGWFEWESEGYPFWSNLHHTQSWWDYQCLDNIMLFHYNDLLDDPCLQIKRLASYLGVTITSAEIEDISRRTSFNSMKSLSDSFLDNQGRSFIGGSKTFFHRGTNGRWKSVLTANEQQKYEQKASSILSVECRSWLERS